MIYPKKALTLDEQADLLLSRGLVAGELVEAAVDVADDVVVDLVIHTCGAWRKRLNLEMEDFLGYMTPES